MKLQDSEPMIQQIPDKQHSHSPGKLSCDRPCLPSSLVEGQPLTALAPMQDVTTLPFMRIIARYGPPDYFFTEYFRVHAHSTLEPQILASITENPSGRPIFAQLIGEDLLHLDRTVRLLQTYPIAGIDLNLGCPAPKVYKKNVGGGLLRDPNRVDRILGCLRNAVYGRFTVKMRVGFEDWDDYAKLLQLMRQHDIDLLSVHARTVKAMYRGEPHYALIRQAVETVHCPVLANGNISSIAKGQTVLKTTGAAGLMIGRSAIRNPWIFRQFREAFSQKTVFEPKLHHVREYIAQLWTETMSPKQADLYHVAYMKKFLNFIGQSVDPHSLFLKEVRRVRSASELFNVCDKHLIEGGRANYPFATEPYEGVMARPNHEAPKAGV